MLTTDLDDGFNLLGLGISCNMGFDLSLLGLTKKLFYLKRITLLPSVFVHFRRTEVNSRSKRHLRKLTHVEDTPT